MSNPECAGQYIDMYQSRPLLRLQGSPKRCPLPENRKGALAGPAFAAEPDDQSKGAVQPAFSAISRPCVKQLEIIETSS